MAFQTDSVAIANGASSGSVVFPAVFASAPQVVIAVVENLSADATIYLLHAQVTEITATGFSYELDGVTNTANYALSYIAGSPDVLFAALTAVGQRLTQQAVFSGTLQDSDRIPLVTMSPLPRSYALTVAALKAVFAPRLAAIPSEPTSTAGDLLALGVDADYLYVRHSTGVARIPISTAAWSISDAHRKRYAASHQCSNGDQVQVITFGLTFPAAPKVRFTIRNTASEAKLLLHGMVTAISTTGFTVTLNSATDSANYYIDYEAESAQA